PDRPSPPSRLPSFPPRRSSVLGVAFGDYATVVRQAAEAEAWARREAERAQREAQARAEAEARLRALEEELRRLRGER
ncbi:MAG: hypothetical protein RMJ96_08930, partial [Candidatus Bipolaricaulota bacterium]|nr:hypothetical protein [Candidatus Bipolaricaulota bacterium]